ncbi:MAG: hypothetical protein ABI895_02360 [Deltaproteobacteria bacterium]
MSGARSRHYSALLFATALAFSAACSHSTPDPSTDSPAPGVPVPAPVPTPVPGPALPPPGAAVAAAALAHDAGVTSPTVKIVFRTFPARRGVVMWGGKRLGIVDRNAPLVVERPRDSGPLDVVVRVTGYIPVHTRAYTFTDSNVDVRITLLDKKDTIYGFKEPLPPDAGVPFPGEPGEIPE